VLAARRMLFARYEGTMASARAAAAPAGGVAQHGALADVNPSSDSESTENGEEDNGDMQQQRISHEAAMLIIDALDTDAPDLGPQAPVGTVPPAETSEEGAFATSPSASSAAPALPLGLDESAVVAAIHTACELRRCVEAASVQHRALMELLRQHGRNGDGVDAARQALYTTVRHVGRLQRRMQRAVAAPIAAATTGKESIARRTRGAAARHTIPTQAHSAAAVETSVVGKGSAPPADDDDDEVTTNVPIAAQAVWGDERLMFPPLPALVGSGLHVFALDVDQRLGPPAAGQPRVWPPRRLVRDYVTNTLTRALDAAATHFLKKLHGLRGALKAKGGPAAPPPRLYAIGLREIARDTAAGMIRLVIIAPDVEPTNAAIAAAAAAGSRKLAESAPDAMILKILQAAGVVLENVGDTLRQAQYAIESLHHDDVKAKTASLVLRGESAAVRRQAPLGDAGSTTRATTTCIFALGRQQLGRIFHQNQISAVGVYSSGGLAAELNRLLEVAAACQAQYRDIMAASSVRRGEAGGGGWVAGNSVA
jgi:hypothetical protein